MSKGKTDKLSILKEQLKIAEDIDKVIQEYVGCLYKSGNMVYDTYGKYTMLDKERSDGKVHFEIFMKRFHTKKVYSIVLEDDYFCGIRANTFVIEYGNSEYAIGNYYVITANHKGLRRTVVIKDYEE